MSILGQIKEITKSHQVRLILNMFQIQFISKARLN